MVVGIQARIVHVQQVLKVLSPQQHEVQEAIKVALKTKRAEMQLIQPHLTFRVKISIWLSMVCLILL